MGTLDAALEALIDCATAKAIERYREAVREEIKQAIDQALERREIDGMIDIRELSQLLGSPSVGAAKQVVRRDPDLGRLVIRVGRARRWRRNEVLRVLEERRRGGK